MKKGIVLILLSIFILTGCSSKIIIEESTKDKGILNKYNIIVREIKDNFQYDYQFFTPLYFKDNNVIGLIDIIREGAFTEDEVNIPIKINTNGEFVTNDDKVLNEFLENDLRQNYTVQAKGINSEGLHTRDRKYFYYDLKEDLKFYLEDLDELYYEMENKFKLGAEEVYDLKNYYILEMVGYEDSEDSSKPLIMKGKAAIVIDKINKTYYKTKINNDLPYIYYFNEKEDSIMALDFTGKIKKLALIEGDIDYLDYKNVNIDEYTKDSFHDFHFTNKYVTENYIVLSRYNEGKYKTFIYDINSGKTKIYNESPFLQKVSNTNYFIVYSEDGIYLSELNENMEFDLLYKLSAIENYDSTAFIGDKKKIFAVLKKYNHENNSLLLADKKYLLINIEEN